jgi:hypothetical protein
MLRGFDHLDGGVVARFDTNIGRQGDLGNTDRPGVGVVGRAGDLERGDHGMAHVGGHGAQTQIDVDQGRRVTLEPARLERDGAAVDRPFGAICRGGHTAA